MGMASRLLAHAATFPLPSKSTQTLEKTQTGQYMSAYTLRAFLFCRLHDRADNVPCHYFAISTAKETLPTLPGGASPVQVQPRMPS